MNSSSPLEKALFGPYTWLEEEVLIWAVLLFGKAVVLYPGPLPLPPYLQEGERQGWVEIHRLPKTREELLERGRILKAVEQTGYHLSDGSLLRYLTAAEAGDGSETEEEILRMLKNSGSGAEMRASSILSGEILLSLLHRFRYTEWELDRSLAEIEGQEHLLPSLWQSELEESFHPSARAPSSTPRTQAPQLYLPEALKTWQGMRRSLVPGPSLLITDQEWVFTARYGHDPEEDPSASLVLPPAGPLSEISSIDPEKTRFLRETTTRIVVDENYRGGEGARALEAVLRTIFTEGQGGWRFFLPPKASSPDKQPPQWMPRDPIFLFLPWPR